MLLIFITLGEQARMLKLTFSSYNCVFLVFMIYGKDFLKLIRKYAGEIILSSKFSLIFVKLSYRVLAFPMRCSYIIFFHLILPGFLLYLPSPVFHLCFVLFSSTLSLFCLVLRSPF